MASQDSWGKIPDAPQVAQQRAAASGGSDSWNDGARQAAMSGEPVSQTTPQTPPVPQASSAMIAPPSAGTSVQPLPVAQPGWVTREDQSVPSGRLTRRTTTEQMTLPEGVLYRTTVQDADAGGAISTSVAQTFVPTPRAGASEVSERIAMLLDRITVLAERQERRDAAVHPEPITVAPSAPSESAVLRPPRSRKKNPREG